MHQFRKYELVAKDSPKKAFYNVFLLDTGSEFVVRKESGAAGKVLDVREWHWPTRNEAETLIISIVRKKTNPKRKSARHYQLVDMQLSLF